MLSNKSILCKYVKIHAEFTYFALKERICVKFSEKKARFCENKGILCKKEGYLCNLAGKYVNVSYFWDSGIFFVNFPVLQKFCIC